MSLSPYIVDSDWRRLQVRDWLDAVPRLGTLEDILGPRRQSRSTALASFLLHGLLLAAIALPGDPSARSASRIAWLDTARTAVHIVSPLFELPQRYPNRGPKNGSSIDLEMLRPAVRLYAPALIPAHIANVGDVPNGSPDTPHPGPPLSSLAALAPQGTGGTRVPASLDASFVLSAATPVPFDIVPPSNVRRRNAPPSDRPAWQAAGDINVPGGGAREGQHLSPSPPAVASTLELLSEPHGLELRSYLAGVLSVVRRNWTRSPLPQPAQGVASGGQAWIEFSIHASGQISHIQVVESLLPAPLLRWVIYGITTADPVASPPPSYPETAVRVRLGFRYLSLPH